MEKLTVDILAERGFSFVPNSHSLMSDGKYIINVYAKPYTSNGETLNTVEDLDKLLSKKKKGG